jgi:hypothetical protein
MGTFAALTDDLYAHLAAHPRVEPVRPTDPAGVTRVHERS